MIANFGARFRRQSALKPPGNWCKTTWRCVDGAMNEDFADLLRAFDSCEVDYLVVGGYAVMAYAEPRFTKDLDIWSGRKSKTARESTEL